MTLDELDLAFNRAKRARHGSIEFASIEALVKHLEAQR
jgi:hypothetical protein